MRYSYLLFFVITTLHFSCKKEYEPTKDQGSGPPSVAGILLKDMVVSRLPEPYYHFEYDAGGKVIAASFASGFNIYQVVYVNGRISEVRNNIVVNKDRLQYFYDNSGRVTSIRYADSTGFVYTRIALSYDGQKLIMLVRERNSGTGFFLDKTISLSYLPDGNLQEITYYYAAINGSPEHTFSERFEEYDDGINVDGFQLIHNDFFDHLLILPGVQLQKNNPGKLTHTGDGINFIVAYTYNYNDQKLPLIKNGKFTYLNGPDAGKKFDISSVFTYY